MNLLTNILLQSDRVLCDECLADEQNYFIERGVEIPDHLDYAGTTDRPCSTCRCGLRYDRLDNLLRRHVDANSGQSASCPQLRLTTPCGNNLEFADACFRVTMAGEYFIDGLVGTMELRSILPEFYELIEAGEWTLLRHAPRGISQPRAWTIVDLDDAP